MRVICCAAAIALAAAALLPAQGQSQPPFTFTKADLTLLDECSALDQQFEKRALIYHDAALEEHLAKLAAPLLPGAPLKNVQWKIRILRDPAANAFGFPNGSIYISTGLLARAENDGQLCGRLAHEIAHVEARHPYLLERSLRKKVVATELAEVGGAFFGFGAFVVAAGVWPDQTAILVAVAGYPRSYEDEADETAVRRLRQAGTDPVQLIRLDVILGDKLEPEPVSFWKDPPTMEKRIAYLNALTGMGGDPGPGTEGGYLDRMRAAILQDIQLAMDTRHFRSAVAAAQRLALAHPDDAVAVYWLGESYRALGPRQERLTARELTPEGMRAAYRQVAHTTEQEEAARLAATPDGKAALAANQQKAEELFRKAAGIDSSLPPPYFGLGSLYEQQGKKQQAIEAYRKYVQLCAQPADRERAQRRVEGLMKAGGTSK